MTKLNTNLQPQSVTLWNEGSSQGHTNQTADSNYILPKGLQAATVETVHNIRERLETEKLLLSHADAPVMFVKLSCVLVLDSLKMSRWKSCTALFSLQQNVRPLRLAPLSGTRCRRILFFSGACRKCYMILYLQGRSQGNRLPIML